MAMAARFSVPAFVLCLPLVAALGCSQGGGPIGDTPPPASAAHGAVIAQLITHDAKIAILSGRNDLRVVVRGLDGTLLADRLTLTELRAQRPELYVLVTSAFAFGQPSDGDRHPYVDATLDRTN